METVWAETSTQMQGTKRKKHRFLCKVLLLAAIVLSGLFLFSIAPNRQNRTDLMVPFTQQYIAHRGFFDNASDWPENSLAAFQKAVEHGYGIELDVRLTADHKLVVFHDTTLDRMCGADKAVAACTYAELQQYRLAGSNQKIPLLQDVLDLVDGRVPLIVEIKAETDWESAAQLTAEAMDGYGGCYCMESFQALVVRWFWKNRPDVLRGQLSNDFFGDASGGKWYQRFIPTNALFNCLSRPDFIAYNHTSKNNVSYSVCRTLFPVGNVAWTIRSQEELEEAKKTFDVIIFDSFIPDIDLDLT